MRILAVLLLLTCVAQAQVPLVNKKVTLREPESFIPDLDDAALYYNSLDSDLGVDLPLDAVDAIVVPKGTRIHVLESSRHPLAEGLLFYRCRILSGQYRGCEGWAFWMNTSAGDTGPSRSRGSSTYPRKRR